MTKDERIKGHFSVIAECAGNLRRNFDPSRVVENDEVAQHFRKQLDAIEAILRKDEPETLGDSVLRLTELCNELEAGNYRLKRALLLAEGNLTMLKKRNDKLEQDLCRADARIEDLQEGIAQKDESLRCRAAEAVLMERDMAHKDRYIEILRRDRREHEELARIGRIYVRTVNRWSPHQ